MPNLQIKRKLAQGEVVTVVGGHFTNSNMIDFLGKLGFAGVWIECEHGPVTWDQISDMSRACDLWNMASIVRVPVGEPWVITRTLDQGASGIVVPHVANATEARNVVEAAKFAPLGKRGIYSVCRRSYEVTDYFSRANEETLVVILIEELEAVNNLDEILAITGIDVFVVAPNDLAQSMGHIGNWKHPEVQAAIERSLRQIAAAGKTAGFLAIEDELSRYLEMGVRFFHAQWPTWVARGAKEYFAKLAAVSA